MGKKRRLWDYSHRTETSLCSMSIVGLRRVKFHSTVCLPSVPLSGWAGHVRLPPVNKIFDGRRHEFAPGRTAIFVCPLSTIFVFWKPATRLTPTTLHACQLHAVESTAVPSLSRWQFPPSLCCTILAAWGSIVETPIVATPASTYSHFDAFTLFP